MGGPQGPNQGSNRGAPKPPGVAVALKLPCATLDEVKALHPEIKARSFFVRTTQPLAMDTVIRLRTQLSDGTDCFRAAAVVERVQAAGGPPGSVPGMTLSLLRMDDRGRELVAWMGGKPPALLVDPPAAKPETASPAPTSKPPPPAGSAPPPARSAPPPARSAPRSAGATAPAGATPPAPASRSAPPPAAPKPPAEPRAVSPASAAPPPSAPASGASPPEALEAPDPLPSSPLDDLPPPDDWDTTPAAPAPPRPSSIAPSVPVAVAVPVSVSPPAPPAAAADAVQSWAQAPAGWGTPADPGAAAAPGEGFDPAWGAEEPAIDLAASAAPGHSDDPWGAAPAGQPAAAPPAQAPARPQPPAPAAMSSAPPAAAAPAAAAAAPVAPAPAAGAPGKATPSAAPTKAPHAASAPARPVGSRPGDLPPPQQNTSRRPEAPLPRPTLAPGAQAPAAIAPDVPEHLEAPPPPRREGPAKGPIIGIDLGTTNSCAAVVREGKPFIIPSREGYNTIPSVVALSDKGKLMVGHSAKSQLLINPRSTVYGAKRLIGRQFNSPVVSEMVGRFSYEIVAGPRGEAAVKLGNQVFSLQKVSSLVLAEVKDLAQQWLGTEVARAVVTVPAYYNDNQRQAVRAAGALAGLEVERILNEPTAAAIAFAHGRTLEQRVMVYDLGGGTFDTSVLQLRGNVYEVISTGGDTFLGGVDFDKALVGELLERFKQKHGIDFPGDRVAYQRVVDAAERAKIALSERLSTQANVPFVALIGDKAYDLDTTVTRAELEKLTTGLIDRSLAVCEQVLASCGLKPGDIGDVLIVGGQSRMPLVRARLRQFFGKEPSKAVHPDEAVALGAAVLAHSIQSDEIGGMVLVDVLPMSIGIGLPGGRFKKVVERNTSLPHKKTHSIWTSRDNQKTLEIPVFQGESAQAKENEYLGTLVVPDLPPGVRGNVVFDIVFSISAESILTVSAEERGTARTVSATFSTQDTPESVKRRLSGSTAAGEEAKPGEPGERSPAPAAAKEAKGGWMKRIFGGD